MSGARTYLDHNATSPLRPEAKAAVISALEALGNPSSVHGEGRKVRAVIEDAREQVAALVGTAPANVVFTSGATEANNWVVHQAWDLIAAAAVEHDSVLAPARRRVDSFRDLPVDDCGRVGLAELEQFAASASTATQSSMVALQFANNETGVLQPINEAAELCREHGLSLHCDGVQAAGRIEIKFDDLGIETLSLSSHKIGGPMGVGTLIIRDGVDLSALIAGGGQERRRRSGTENVAGIAGFGAAAEVARAELSKMPDLSRLRDRLERDVSEITPEAVVIAANAERLANTTCVALPGVSSETLLIKCDLAGVAISSGAACSSGKVGTSHVLDAMGIAPDVAKSAVRISLGWNTSDADVDAFVTVWRGMFSERERAVA